jgi:hypothetical protein
MQNEKYITPADIDFSNCVEDDFEEEECCPRGTINEAGYCTWCNEYYKEV